MSDPLEAGKGLTVDVTWNLLSREFKINIVTEDVQVARDVCDTVKTLGEAASRMTRDVCITAVSLGALYLGYKLVRPLIETAVKKGLGGERDDQEVRDIRSGSLHVLLHCLTVERFLEVLADYESGKIKESLQKEFSQVGIKVEGLKVEIENMEEVNETKEAIKKSKLKCPARMADESGYSPGQGVFVDRECNTENGQSKEEITKNSDSDLNTYQVNYSSTARRYHSIGLQHKIKEYKSYQHALQISLKLFGEDHSETARSYNNIGVAQHEMKDYKSALESHQHALQIRLKLFGEENLATALSYHNIGVTQHEMKDYKSALESHQHALQIRLELFGEDHRDTALSYYSIGCTQRQMKDYESALKSHKRACRIRLKLLEEDHSDTDISKPSRCAPTYYSLRAPKLLGTSQTHPPALQSRLKRFGEVYYDIAVSYDSIGLTQHEMKYFMSASKSHRHALQIRLELFGEDHCDTARSYHNIGVAQHEMKDYKLALEAYQHALQIRLALFGEDHCDTALSYYSIALTKYLKSLGDTSTLSSI